ncbi:MAG TPA: VTT domain-containing protein [Vicinamibacterales bacterium]|jgi:membrane protein DedA with SNARE-associated domain|nr:VTT domain-containing protein [Vicinamibacterales bacterium]
MFLSFTTLAGLAAGTLLSEDLTSIGAGLLVRDGQLGAAGAVLACSAGVYLGDLGLWAAGRLLGRRLLVLPWLACRLDEAALEALAARLDSRLGAVVLGSRFLPGSRLPMFVAAGIWGRRPWAFVAWSLLAVLLWTPLLVLLTAWFGPSLTNPIVGELGNTFRWAITTASLFVVIRLAVRVVAIAPRAINPLD